MVYYRLMGASCLMFLQWDILSNGGVVQEMAHIANGRGTGNCVSLLRVNVTLLPSPKPFKNLWLFCAQNYGY